MLTLLFVYLTGFIVCLLGGAFLAGAVNSIDNISLEEVFETIINNWWHGILIAAMWPVWGLSALGWALHHLWKTRHPVAETKE
jgi:hypothetical protein